jgi:hypothetical protein
MTVLIGEEGVISSRPSRLRPLSRSQKKKNKETEFYENIKHKIQSLYLEDSMNMNES